MTNAGDAIVAPTQPAAWAVARWRLWVAAALIVAAGLGALVRALGEPSTGYRFTLDASGRIEARPLTRGLPPLQDVQALRAGGVRVPLQPQLLVESGGIINRYDEQRQFYATHAQLWPLLHQDRVDIEHAGGVTQAATDAKPLAALGLRFWYPWLVGLLSLSVGLGLWMYSPRRDAAWYFLISSASFAYIMLLLSTGSSRLLTQAPEGWVLMHRLTHVAAFAQNGALCLLLWNHPARLGGRWFGALLAGWSLAWLTVDFGELVDTISLGFRLPVALFGPLFAILFALQWRRARGLPLQRAQLKWLTLLFAAAFSVIFLAYLYGATGAPVTAPQAYGLSWLALLYLGLVPVVTRVGLFQIEAWWVRAWLWFLGGLLVVALDALFLGVLAFQADYALLLALALGGWVYFPLRQWLWRKLSHDGGASARDLLPDVVALISRSAVRPAHLPGDWRALWDKAFAPQSMAEADATGEDARVLDEGRRLLVPGAAGLPALSLSLAARGQRLFSPVDARRADEISRLVRLGLQTQAAVESGVHQERVRIAADLHDDLGATLLTMAQASQQAGQGQRVAALARQALEEMRLAVRGFAVESALLADVLADWRAETVTRLDAAGFTADWQAGEPPTGLALSARQHGQLTRVLREALSNVIRHSQGSACRVKIDIGADELRMEVSDNGQGLAVDPRRSANPQGNLQGGQGLPNIERRIRKLGGQHGLGPAPDGGTLLWIKMPWQVPSATIDAT